MVRALWNRYQLVGSIAFLSMSLTGCAHGQELRPLLTCQPPEGSLTVSIISGLHRWTYNWREAKVTFLGEEPPPLPMHIFQSGSSMRGRWDGEQAGVDQYLVGPASRLDVPYMVSPDGTWLASAVYTKIPDELPPLVSTHLALIRRTDPTVIHHIQFPQYIKALTWSPSGRFFAVMLGEPVSGPISDIFGNWIGALGGHPSSYYTLRGSIYDVDGKLLCTQLFREQVPSGGGYLEWNPS